MLINAIRQLISRLSISRRAELRVRRGPAAGKRQQVIYRAWFRQICGEAPVSEPNGSRSFSRLTVAATLNYQAD
jgi:hypothetical protein